MLEILMATHFPGCKYEANEKSLARCWRMPNFLLKRSKIKVFRKELLRAKKSESCVMCLNDHQQRKEMSRLSLEWCNDCLGD